MTIRIYYNIHGLFLEDKQGYILDSINIEQNEKLRTSLFFSEEFIKKAGTKILKGGTNKYAFAWFIAEIDKYENEQTDVVANLLQSQAYMQFRQVESFLQFLWFVKDNSICIDQCNGFVPKLDILLEMKSTVSNSTADGKFIDSKFTSNEIESVIKIRNRYMDFCAVAIRYNDVSFIDVDPNSATILRVTSHPERKHYNEHNRIARAMTFLANARNTLEISHKITLYIAILECLFSIDSDEVKHKVAERTAYYINVNREDKVNTYNLISFAYNIRSKFIHGSPLRSKGKDILNEKLMETSVKLDSLIRIVLTKVIMEDSSLFLQKDDDMSNFYKTLIFN